MDEFTGKNRDKNDLHAREFASNIKSVKET